MRRVTLRFLRWNPRRTCLRRFCSSTSAEEPVPAHVLLGVGRTCTKEELRNAYYLKAKACHPDVNQFNPEAKENFTLISRAYQTMLNKILEREASGERMAVLP
mmetsp:Transcript_15169/g.30705  ORF Transcript_15169/g.30705 Transcript_15169/m.30705 type:complete len:103 (-) Transcript_15169:420-728(-)